MQYIKWILRTLMVLVGVVVLLFSHYTLPSRDIVRVVGTDVKRMDIGSSSWFWASPDAGTGRNDTRDVRFINAVWPDGSPRVYRNEDTNWNWPPYFKFDSGNMVAQSQALAGEDDTWVAITHYGWRLNLLSVFPNAIKIKRVEGPDTFLIPWFNIIFFSLLALLIFWVWRLWRRFKVKKIDPAVDEMMDDIESGAAEAQSRAEEAQRGLRAWFKRWFG